MEALDEKIAMLERGQRLEKRKSEQVIIEAVEEEQLSIDDIRAGIQKGHVVFPEDRELTFKTNFLFSEKIPLIYIDDFYTDYQETEEMVIYVNNKRDMGQTLVHLPKEMEKISVESWADKNWDERTGAVYRYCKEEKIGKFRLYYIPDTLQEGVDL